VCQSTTTHTRHTADDGDGVGVGVVGSGPVSEAGDAALGEAEPQHAVRLNRLSGDAVGCKHSVQCVVCALRCVSFGAASVTLTLTLTRTDDGALARLDVHAHPPSKRVVAATHTHTHTRTHTHTHRTRTRESGANTPRALGDGDKPPECCVDGLDRDSVLSPR